MNSRTQAVVALLGVRFVLELCLLVAVSAWGFSTGGTVTRWLLGLGAPALVGVTWSVFVSPKATVSLPLAARLVIELVLFALASLALWSLDRETLALALIVVEIVTVVLLIVLKRPPGT